MISVQRKFLFIHVPKTGGNSIQSILKDYADDTVVITSPYQDGVERFELRIAHYDTRKHSTLSQYKKVLDPKLYDDLFKVAVIRNPWDRLVSWYFSPRRVLKRGEKKWERNDFIQLVNRAQPLRHYIAVDRIWTRIARRTGLSIRAGGQKALDQDIDFLMRFEHLDDDFRTVCSLLEIPYQPLPVRNKSDREHYSHYYDKALKDMVRAKFGEEILFGNYDFEAVERNRRFQ